MATVEVGDATLHVEVDGEGEPVTVLAHGLTNNSSELAAFTPFIPGTKVRFDFRGHGRSTAPSSGYRFADLARDLDAVAKAYTAQNAVGTSLGAGAICHLVAREPERFRRLVFLLPAALDGEFLHRERLLKTAETIEGAPPHEEIEAVLADPDRVADYLQAPWREQVDREMWRHEHPEGIARAIREVIEDRAVDDREELRAVTAPTLILCLEGDPIHPAELGEVLVHIMPNSELVTYESPEAMLEAVPFLVAKVSEFLAAP